MRIAVIIAVVCGVVTVQAVDRYVSLDGGHVAPFTSWADAATNIQDAIDVSVAGETVWVTNGVYSTGGKAIDSIMTNRVAVDKPLSLLSVNGAEFTIIKGYQLPGTTNGDGAIRCVYLTNGASLVGFTLTNGATRSSGSPFRESSGGGLWCESTNAWASNCVITGNSAIVGGGSCSGTIYNCTLTGNSATGAYGSGGGAYLSTLNNCTITDNLTDGYGGGSSYSTLNSCTLTGNSAGASGGGSSESTLYNCTLTGNSSRSSGGGSSYGTLYNCTLWDNSAYSYGGGSYEGTLNNCTLTGNSSKTLGGGAYSGALNNCIVYFNRSIGEDSNYRNSSLNYCCTTPLPSDGTGNISTDPLLASVSHLSAASPCRAAGSATYTTGTDIDGESWASPPSMGCDEYWSGSVTGALSVAMEASHTNVVAGITVDFAAFISGRVTASTWDFSDGTVVSNQPHASHAWAAVGDYPVVLRAYNESWPGGVSATVTVQVAESSVHYVAAEGTNPVPPYASWATAATNIQDAVDAATVSGALILVTNGVYATGGKAVYGTVTNRVAVDKPLTLLSVNGPQFTIIEGYQVPGTITGDGAIRCVYLTNGASLVGFTLTNGATRSSSFPFLERSGGGLLCESPNAWASNCVITGNSADYGGGSCWGTLNNCILLGNSASHGGGAAEGILNNCTITDNSADYYGGGSDSGTLNNCLLTGNSAGDLGGGTLSATLNNCTLTDNSAGRGGGSYSSTLRNCIVYFNTAFISGDNYSGGSLNYTCSTPLPIGGTGNIDLNPLLASVSHLSAASPCRAAGSAAYSTGTDVDGESWANPPSMGCDEYWSGSVTGALSVAIESSLTYVAVSNTVDFAALISGRTTDSVWNFGDGTVVSNQPSASHAWAAAGVYPVVLRAYNESWPGGVSATVTVQVVESRRMLYVAVDSANPTPPYASWATAATNIQDAVDVALAEDTVWVSNGVYAAGGRAVFGTMTNRVTVDKPLTLLSVNGPEVTVIKGYQVPGTINGHGAVRCVYLTNGASLSGFTLTNGATRTDGDAASEQNGGGLWCESTSAWASNCVMVGNSTDRYGGGSYDGTLIKCTLTDNSARFGGGGSCRGILNSCILTGNSGAQNGGGSYSGTLNNCTLTGNSAYYGGGSYSSKLRNCIVYFNTAFISGDNYSGGSLNYTCSTPLPIGGTGNIELNPLLGSVSHLSAASPCRAAGSAAYSAGTDVDGEPWANPPSMGCDEYWSGSATGALSVAIEASHTIVKVTNTVDFAALISGRMTDSVWNFGDGTLVSNQPYASHAWTVAGDYPVVLEAYNESWPGGVSATVTVQVAESRRMLYVAVDSANPTPPYSSWATAATNIQDAIDVALAEDTVWVSNGVYDAGGKALYGTMTNRVAVNKPLTLLSVNGPEFTIIKGYQVPGTTNGDGAIRCVYLTNGASLSGFTLTNGATRTAGDAVSERSGGGLWCESTNAWASNCVMVGNSTDRYGGGSYDGTLIKCMLTDNSARLGGGGSYVGTLNNCTLTGNRASSSGGGAYSGTLNNCTLTGNWASSYGGGAHSGTLNNCTLTGNSAYYGGGSYFSTLNNCNLTGNSVDAFGGGSFQGVLNNCTVTGNSAGVVGGGSHFGRLNNCIVWGNVAPILANYGGGPANNTCTTPLAPGLGNIDTDPQLVDGMHIAVTSPCRGAGSTNYSTGTDIDGEAWLNPPSMGCDEVWEAGITGALSVAASAAWPTVAEHGSLPLAGYITGRASGLDWSFGDGPAVTNLSYLTSHIWTNAGDYTVTFTAFNADHPAGVTTNLQIQVVPLVAPTMAAGSLSNAYFSLSFPGQPGVTYVVEQATNLAPPVLWQTVRTVSSAGEEMQVTDTKATNDMRFYRVRVP